MGANWITNSPEIARQLHKIDADHEAAREAARHLPLAEKVAAYRAAKITHQAAYDAIANACA